MSKNLKSLNLSKFKNKKMVIVSSENALKDVSPINWAKEVLSGQKRVTLTFLI